jgi:basic amino acid/polyamine antiporter, APA family
MPKRKLKRSLGLWQTTLYGVGIIFGAGIYALIGTGAGVAGNGVWLSFVIAGILALFTGFSYAELSSMYSKDAAEYVYTKKAFGKPALSFVVEWVMLFTVIVSGATVAIGFGGYFSHLFGVGVIASAIGLTVVLSAINYFGMKESSAFNIISTLIESAGLVVVVLIGLFFAAKSNIDLLAMPAGGFTSIIAGTSVIFFAYLGFEQMVNLSEETKNPKKTMHQALIIALTISTIIYIIVAITAVSVVGADRLAASKAPLTEVVSSVMPDAAFIFSIIALFATGNTILIIMLVGSRMLYGLSMQKKLPRAFSIIGRRNTPYVAIAFIMIVTMILVNLTGIKSVALLTDIGLFVVYAFINASLICLRYRQPRAKRSFRSPINIGKLPVLAVLGLVSSIAMLFHFDLIFLLCEAIVALAGFTFYRIYVMRKGSGKNIRRSFKRGTGRKSRIKQKSRSLR